MAPTARDLLVQGQLWGWVITLENVGDILPVHSHGDADNHISIIAFGSVRLLGARDGEVLVAGPGGTIVEWGTGESHGFAAVSDGATIVNVLRHRR